MLSVLPILLNLLLLQVLKIDANSHFSMIRNTSGSVRCQRVGVCTASVNCLFSMLGSSSYPRLHVPSQIPRQTDLNTSPATLFLSGKMHEIVLHGTPDGKDLSSSLTDDDF